MSKKETENLRSASTQVADLQRQLEVSKKETENLRSATAQLPPAVEENTAYPVVEMTLLRSQVQNLEGVIEDLQQKLKISDAQLVEFRSAQIRDAEEKNTTQIPMNHFRAQVAKLTNDNEKLQQQLDVALQEIQELRAQPLPVVDRAARLIRRFPHLDETFVVLNRNALVISELTELFSCRPSQTGEEGFVPSMRKIQSTSRLRPSSSIQNSEGEVAEQDPNDVRSYIRIFQILNKIYIYFFVR